MKRPPKPTKPEVETDPRFPSGRWTGFWLQRAMPGRQYMGLHLTFASGAIVGSGTDRVGEFTMRGAYDLKTGKVEILKDYVGAHRVRYEGRNDGDGLWVWGLWRMILDQGGFHIWPEGEEDPTKRHLKREEDTPVEAERPRVLVEPVGT